MQRTGAEEKIVFNVVKACCWGKVQDHGWSLQVRRTMGVTMSEKLGMNFQ